MPESRTRLAARLCAVAWLLPAMPALALAHTGTAIVATPPAGVCTSGLCLALTVTTDPPPACGSASTLTVAIGTAVNFCYTATNASGVELDYHTLGDSLTPEIFRLFEHSLPDGASFQYNRVVTILADTTIDATWTAQDALPGYTHATTSGGFVDISAIGTPLSIGNEAIVGVTLPFAFEFYGQSSTALCVSSDAFALFGLWPCPTYSYYSNQPLPTSYLQAPAFLALWEELLVGDGEVYAATLGAAPNRRFVVEWKDRPPYGATDPFTLELILDEASGRIAFEYADVDTMPAMWSNGGLATIGLQATPTLADEFSYFDPSVTSGSGIEWLPTVPQTFAASASASVAAGGPIMSVSPAAARATLLSGTSTDLVFTISNSGDAPLTWTAAETPAARRARPAGTNPLPAFAEDIAGGRFVRLDARDPGTLTEVAATDYVLTGGDFANNDPTRLYGLDGSDGPHRDRLAAVDTATGATTEIGVATPTGEASWTSLKWDATTLTLYAVASDCEHTNSTLYTIDRGSGAATRIGPISTGGRNCIMSIAIDPTGRMFGIDLVNPDALVEIDKTTGEAHRVAALDVAASGNQGMDYDDASGVLYWARHDEPSPGVHVSEMRTINTTTAATTLIGAIGSGAPEISAFAIGTAGDCANPADLPWLSLSPAQGTVAAGGSSDFNVGLDATGLAAGTYRATICVSGDDPESPMEQLTVELEVIDANDVIFRNGFEGA